MSYKLVSKKRDQYILYVVDRHKGVLKVMHPEENTFEELESKINPKGTKEQVQVKKNGIKKKGGEEEEDKKEVINE